MSQGTYTGDMEAQYIRVQKSWQRLNAYSFPDIHPEIDDPTNLKKIAQEMTNP